MCAERPTVGCGGSGPERREPVPAIGEERHEAASVRVRTSDFSAGRARRSGPARRGRQGARRRSEPDRDAQSAPARAKDDHRRGSLWPSSTTSAIEGGELAIGALTRHNAVLRSAEVAQHCPLIAEAYRFVSHHAIRNRGTIGGNLCHADPASELPVVALLLDATMVLKSSSGERRVSGRRLLQGPVRDRGARRRAADRGALPGPAQGPGLRVRRGQPAPRRLRAGRRRLHACASRTASAARSGSATPGSARTRCASPRPRRRSPASRRPRRISRRRRRPRRSTCDPTSDVHADAAYRRDLVRALTSRVLAAALARCA